MGTYCVKNWLKHASKQCIIDLLQVFLQYSGVSAWVPASFAVPTLLPKVSLQSIKQLGKKKSKEQTDKEFRQARVLLCSHCFVAFPAWCGLMCSQADRTVYVMSPPG